MKKYIIYFYLWLFYELQEELPTAFNTALKLFLLEKIKRYKAKQDKKVAKKQKFNSQILGKTTVKKIQNSVKHYSKPDKKSGFVHVNKVEDDKRIALLTHKANTYAKSVSHEKLTDKDGISNHK